MSEEDQSLYNSEHDSGGDAEGIIAGEDIQEDNIVD